MRLDSLLGARFLASFKKGNIPTTKKLDRGILHKILDQDFLRPLPANCEIQ